MNVKGLAKQYDKLTPMERFALLMGAAGRDDDLERMILLNSAPKKHYSMSDHHGVVDCFIRLSYLHLMTLMELAALYFEAFGDVRRQGNKEKVEGWPTVLLLGYEFRIHWDGWQKFCADLNLLPEHLWKPCPGYQLVKRAERVSGPNPATGLPGAAYAEEGVARYLLYEERGDSDAVLDDEAVKAVQVLNADDMAATLHTAFEMMLEKWDLTY